MQIEKPLKGVNITEFKKHKSFHKTSNFSKARPERRPFTSWYISLFTPLDSYVCDSHLQLMKSVKNGYLFLKKWEKKKFLLLVQCQAKQRDK